MARFKIDFNPRHSGFSAFILFYRKQRLFGFSWDRVDTFESVEKAREHYEKIKDMPEYLP